MLKNLIVLPNATGTEISTGDYAVQSAKYTEYANSETELTLGSVCSSMLEVKFFSPGGKLSVAAGTEVAFYKVDDAGERHKIGLFTLETPEASSKNTYKFTAYDRVSWLDKDLSSWLDSLDGWPYSLLTFAQMVCGACGLTLVNDSIPNANFPVNKFRSSEATGRKLMSWIGQLAARFVRATADGGIEFAWYTSSGVTLMPGGSRYYRSLKYEGYQVAKIDSVQVRLADSDYGLLWPGINEGDNCYTISGNSLITSVTDDLLPYLEVIQQEIGGAEYRPCKVVIPACLDIRAGHTVDIVDPNGVRITTYVMSRTQKGQLDTLECTGSPRRDSSTAMNSMSVGDLKDYANMSADAAVKRQTQLELFNKLTNNGQIQGLFMEQDGQVYVNAAYISTGVLASKDGTSFYLDLDTGTFYSAGKFMAPDGKSYITVDGGCFVLYAQDGYGSFVDIARIGFSEDSEGVDYPYMLLGNAGEGEQDKLSLVKAFANGIYIGNAVPRLSTGNFNGLTGAAGIFVDTVNHKSSIVIGEELYDAFAAVFG